MKTENFGKTFTNRHNGFVFWPDVVCLFAYVYKSIKYDQLLYAMLNDHHYRHH